MECENLHFAFTNVLTFIEFNKKGDPSVIMSLFINCIQLYKVYIMKKKEITYINSQLSKLEAERALLDFKIAYHNLNIYINTHG
jgi:hypothetical protein